MSQKARFLWAHLDLYDSQLIEEEQNLCKVLNLTTKTRRLIWRDRVPWSKIKSDDCHLGHGVAVFPDRMKGRLEPKEWRPLMASHLIYRNILVRNPPSSLLVTMLATAILMTVGGGIMAVIFGNSLDLPFFLYTILVVGPFVVSRITQASKKQRLQADVIAAKSLGKDEFLLVLRKIEGMALPDIIETEKRGFSRHFSGKPSVAERIANLSSTTGTI
jgi:hypothetical protein